MRVSQRSARRFRRAVGRIVAGSAALFAAGASAGDRLPGTGGLMQVEGAAGGGLAPMALIAGRGTDGQIGASGFLTRVDLDDFRLDAAGVAAGLFDRLEISYARQRFDLGDVVPGEAIRMDTVGVKLRLAGDAVFDQDRPWPQVAVGLQYKRNLDFDRVPAALGADDAEDVDVYLAATKLWLAGPFGRTWLANLALRSTRANQFGLLGFGGEGGSREWVPEFTVGAFVLPTVALGAEYRAKPDLLAAREDDARDLWVAWIPDGPLSVTLAWLDLGAIAGQGRQRGWYVSLQGSW